MTLVCDHTDVKALSKWFDPEEALGCAVGDAYTPAQVRASARRLRQTVSHTDEIARAFWTAALLCALVRAKQDDERTLLPAVAAGLGYRLKLVRQGQPAAGFSLATRARERRGKFTAHHAAA